MTTKEVAKRIGVTAGCLRLWEREKRLPRITRDNRNWRVWSENDVKLCQTIMLELHPNGVQEDIIDDAGLAQ